MTVESQFLDQADEFIESALKDLGYASLSEAAAAMDEPPVPLNPVVIEDFRDISPEQLRAIRDAFYGPFGTAYYIIRNHERESRLSHQLLDISEQLTDYIPVKYPLDHEKDTNKRVIERLGVPHGVVPVFDQGGSGVTGSDDLYAHQAGMGSCGTVATTIIHADIAPHFGGFTYFQNVARAALALAASDPSAFRALFYPDALTVQRRSGEPGLRMQAPILFVNAAGEPQSLIQTGNKGYEPIWRPGDDVDRARRYIERTLRAFAPGSGFVHFTSPGQGIITRNAPIAHGRTAFGDIDKDMPTRRLARKWYAISEAFTTSRQAPGLNMKREYAQLYPRFLEVDGFWQYNASKGVNERIA